MKKMSLLYLALVLNGAGHAYFAISIAATGRLLNIADLNIGLLLSIPALLLMFTAPVWGRACDHFGRKQVITTGLISSAIGMIAIASLLSIATMLTTTTIIIVFFSIRILHAALSAGLKPGIQATICDVTEPQSRIRGMSIMGASFGTGTVVGGATAMLTGSDSTLAGFLILGSLMLVSSLLVAIQLPETRPATSDALQHADNWQALLPYLCVTAIAIAAYSALQPVSNWMLQDQYKFSPDAATRFTGAMMMSSMLAMIVTQLLLAKMSVRPDRTFSCGLVISILALAFCSFAFAPAMLLCATTGIGVGLGALLPSNLVLMTSGNHGTLQGRVAGLNGLSQGLGMSAGPLVGTLLYKLASPAPYLAFSLLFIATGALLALVRKRK